jgi:hypothetical protein
MDSRTLIKQVLAFAGAPRIGFNLPRPWPTDLAHAWIGPPPGFDPQRRTEGDSEVWLDEWGCTWKRLGGITKGEVVRGAIADWKDLDAWQPPDYGLASRYDGARRIFAEAGGKYRIGHIPTCAFSVTRNVRRLDNFLADCLLEPERVRVLNERVVAEMEKAVRRLADAGAAAVMFGEDWGTQDRLLISPRTWRDLFLPCFERVCGAAGEAGLDIWMHSCGNIWEIIPELIDVGVRVLQFDQPALYGIERLNEAFGGRVTFECPVDIQSAAEGLQSRRADVIRAAARRMIETLGGHGGGFVATRYPDEPAIGLEAKWQDAACDAFVEFGSGLSR